MLIVQRLLTLSCYPSLTFITLSWSSRLFPVSAQNWCMKVFASWPTLVCPCIEVNKRMSPMNLSLFLQQIPACFVRFTRMGCEMGGKWAYNCCFLGAASGICSKQHVVFLCGSYLALYIYIYIYRERERETVVNNFDCLLSSFERR